MNNEKKDWCSFDPVQEYKSYEITDFGGSYSVLYLGDEVIFESIEEAKDFIDYICSKEGN